MGVRIVLEGGRSDTERLELDDLDPPPQYSVRDERYGPVLDHWDHHMQDIAGRWRYRLIPDWLEMKPGHSAPRIKP